MPAIAIMQTECKRRRCVHSRRNSSPRRHGYCCNACKSGKSPHSRNCTGHRLPIVPDFKSAGGPFDARGNVEIHWPHRQATPASDFDVVMAASEDTDAALHGNTKECSDRPPHGTGGRSKGQHHSAATRGDRSHYGRIGRQPSRGAAAASDEEEGTDGADTSLWSGWQRRAGSGVRPAWPLPAGMSVVTYIRELVSRHGLALSAPAEQAWQKFEKRLTSSFWPPPERRTLHLQPHAQDRVATSEFQHLHIDVALRGVDGKSNLLYKLADVTGVDECVQAVVASQEATANCLLAALERVEEEDVHKFSFVCHGATHRSVACCFLFAALAYPKAEIQLTTARTRDAAAKAGLPTARRHGYGTRVSTAIPLLPQMKQAG